MSYEIIESSKDCRLLLKSEAGGLYLGLVVLRTKEGSGVWVRIADLRAEGGLGAVRLSIIVVISCN